MEGDAFQSNPIEKVSVSELNNLKFEGFYIKKYFLVFKIFFLGLKSFKDKFEKGEDEFEANNKSISDIGIELKNIKKVLEKVE